jgi:hypothetical protein
LFCAECKQLPTKLETYFANEWFERGKLRMHVTDDLVQIDGLEYSTFKLFHHSVLFRASVSTLPQFKFASFALIVGAVTDKNWEVTCFVGSATANFQESERTSDHRLILVGVRARSE